MSTGTSRRKNEASPEPRGTGSCLAWRRPSGLQPVTQVAPAVNYWFMLPACVIIAGVAVFCGISGATMLLPLFFVLFPLFGVPALTVPQAVGAALVLQVAAFGLAVYRYARRGLARWDIVGRVALGIGARRNRGCRRGTPRTRSGLPAALRRRVDRHRRRPVAASGACSPASCPPGWARRPSPCFPAAAWRCRWSPRRQPSSWQPPLERRPWRRRQGSPPPGR